VIDLHSHVLPGIDDGPADLEGSLALARAAVSAGTQIIAATPHIGPDHGVLVVELPARLADLREKLDHAGIPLDVIAGGELAASHAADASAEELQAITLGDSSCVRLECPFVHGGGLMPAIFDHLRRRGHEVLLAHPERSPEFLKDPQELGRLIAAGAYVQITAGSLSGDFGRTAQRYAVALLENRLVHVVASDAHDAEHRPPEVLAIMRENRVPAPITRYLTEDAPRALLADAPVPPFPRPEGRARRWRRR
jgi:protein-tyrosine phosphatase